ncbi:MFS transporter, partial [Candidatus Bathyarchaeota archaeon]
MAFNKALKSSFPLEVLNKDLKLIFVSNLAGSFGDGLYAYILPYYMRESLSATPAEVGILYALVNIVSAITLFFAGMIADKYDRKKIMIAGWLSWLPAPIIFSLATNWLQMLPGMILWGFWLGGPSTAYIITSADKRRLTLTFTMISSAWSLGYIFSPAIGGYLADAAGMKIVFYLAFIFYVSATLTLLFISSQRAEGYEKREKEHKYSFF